MWVNSASDGGLLDGTGRGRTVDCTMRAAGCGLGVRLQMAVLAPLRAVAGGSDEATAAAVAEPTDGAVLRLGPIG